MAKRNDADRTKNAKWRRTHWDLIRQSAKDVKSITAISRPTMWTKLTPEKFAAKVNEMLQGE